MFYAIYKGDKFVGVFDTIRECAEYLGIKEESAKWLTKPGAHKRSEGNKTLIYKMTE